MEPGKLYLETGDVKAYAIRRVNPFLGVLQVIETEGGRAVSSNGVVWEIELRTERAAGWGSLNKGVTQAIYYRFGLWSAEDGLVNRPLAPHLDRDPLTIQSDILIRCIEERLQYIPFKLIDNRELWLFDKQQEKPIALLASLSPDMRTPAPEPKYWKSCLGANGVSSQFRFPAARDLEVLVADVATTNINTLWVDRDEDGAARTVRGDEYLDAVLFPSFLINESMDENIERSLVSDYIAWIAPSLLTLQSLNADERDRLESCLNVQAVSVEYHWHLYPELVDEKKLTAARVQCRLQGTTKTKS